MADPPLPPGVRIRRWYLLELAGWCRALRRYDTALRWYHEALRVSPEDPLVLRCIGFHMAEHGRKRDALTFIDRALARDPDRPESHFDRGFLLQELNDHEAAVLAFRDALAHDPKHDRAHYGLGISLVALRRLDEAVAPLEKNTKLQPMSPYGWYQLGRVQFERGNPDRAQAIIDHLGRFEPKVARQLARETGLRAPPSP